jgi:VCBS repeat-containing protein
MWTVVGQLIEILSKGTPQMTETVFEELEVQDGEPVALNGRPQGGNPLFSFSVIDQDLQWIVGQLPGSDPDGDTFTFLWLDSQYGVVEIDVEGFFVYQPTSNFTKPHTFTYFVNDGSLNSEPVVVSMDVQLLRRSGSVFIEGVAFPGAALSASNDLEDPDGIPEAGSGAITYQWRRGSDADLSGAVDADEWQDIDGATQDTYQIDQSDRGSYLSVVAAYVDLGNTSESVASSPVQVWSLLQANPSDTDIPFKLNVQRLTEVFGNGVAVSVDFETGRVWLDDHPEIEEFFDASQLQDLNFSVRNFQGNQTPTSYLSETFYYGQSQKTLIDWTPGDNVYQLPVARDHYFYLPNYELDATLVSVVEDGVLNVQTEYGLTTFYNIGTIIDSRGNDSMVGGDGDDILRASYSSSATVPGMDTYLGGTGDDTFRFEIWADSYNEAGSVYLGDYEDGERIEVQTNGIGASNFKDVITVTYDAAADQTTASLLLDGYSIPALFVVDGVREIIPTSYRFNPNAWFPESSFSLYDPSNVQEPTGEVLLVGFPQVGSSLSIQANIKDAYGFGSYQYEWYADDVKLPEYTQAVLPVSETMLGKSVSARIIYSDFLGQTHTFSSDPTLIKSTPTPDGVVVETSFGDQTARDISATVALLGDDGIGTLTDAIVNKLLNVVDLPQIVGYEVGADSLVLSHTNGSVTYFEDVVFTPASPSAGSATAGRILHDDGDRLELGGRFSFSYDMVAQFFELSSAVDVDYMSRTGIGSTRNGSVTFVLSEFQFEESSISGVVTEVVGYDLSDPAFSYAFSGPISFNTSVSLLDGEPSLTTLLDGNLEQYLFEDTNAKIHYQRPLTSGGPSADIAFASLFDEYQFSEAGDLFHADQLPDTWDLDLMLDMGAGADSVLIEDGGGAFLTIDTGAGNDRVTLGGDGDVGGIELGEGNDYLELKSLGQFGGNAFYGGNGVDTLKLSFATEDAFEIVTEDAESLIVKYLDTAVQQTFIGFERVEFLDLTPPELIAFAVEFSSGASGQSATLTLTFSEDIQAGTGDLMLKASSGSAFTQIQSIDINGNDVSISGNTLTINTSEVFADWGAYRFFLPISIVNDLSGNGNASTESNSFYPDIPSPEGSGFTYGQNPLDMSDLFGFYDGTQTFTYTLLDDVNRLVDGFTIPDVFWMQWTESGEQFRISLGGEGFEVDTTGRLVAGLVYGMTLDSNNADINGYKHYFSLGGSPFSVADWSAALTSANASSADNFLAQVLRGADQVTGSAYDDTLLSFEGNDIIAGLGGDDFIDGGGGDDKAYFRGNITEYTVSFDDLEQVWVVKDSVLGRDGEDRLKGFEQFVFIDSTYEVPNQTPVAINAAVVVHEDDSLSGQLTASDYDGDALQFEIVGDPSHGTVTIETDGSYTYTPSANYNGTDSFTFKVNDGTVDSVDATVSITVSAVNDLPLAPNAFAPLELGRTNERYAVSTEVLTQGFTDLDGDALSVAAPGVDDGDVALAADGTVTVTPAKNFSGVVNLTYDVIDGHGGEVSVSRKIVFAQKGIAQDGYLANALVWADSDGDGKWTHEAFEDANNNQQVDAGEYVDENGDGEFTAESWAITDAEGGFEGVAGSGDLKIEAWVYNADGSSPTIDLSTGKVFKGSLTAPSGSTVINPLTTLIQSAIASGQSADDAQALVRTALGVSAGVDLLNFDPVAQSQSGTDTTEALKVQKAALQVANLMHVAVETTAAAGSSNSKGSISGVANALVSAAKNSTSAGTIDLSSGDLMSSALDAAADEAFKVDQGEEASAEAVTAKAVLKAQAQSIGSALAQVNTSIETIVTQAISAAQTGEAVDTASAMVNIVAAQIVAQEQVTTQAQNSVVASVLSGDTTSAGSVSFSSDEMAQGLSLAKSKVAQVFVAQEGAAPLAVNDQVRMALPGNVSQSRADLTKTGNVLNNDTASFNTKVVKQVGVTAATLQSVPGEGITIAGLYGSLALQSDGSYTYTEDQTKTQAVAVGGITTDVFTYELGDGSAGDERLDTGTVTIGIDRINVAPIVGIATLKLKEAGVGDAGSGQTTLNLLAQASDADGDTLSTTSVKIGSTTLGASGGSVTGAYGTLSLADGVYAYTPDQNSAALQALAPGQTLRETIRYTVGDGYNTVQGTYVVQIEGANDAPTLVAPLADKRVAEGKTLVFSVPADAFSDVDDAALTYTATLENGDPLPSWLVFDAQDRAFTATPSEAVVGETAETLRIKVSATDAANASVSDTFDLTVKPFGSGYDINATARFWNKPAGQSDYAKLAGVTLAVGSESDTSTASGVMALSSVEDTYGEDDGQLILSPTLDKLTSKGAAGISLSDVIGSLKLFLGLSLPANYASPYNYIAADLNANGKVELSDVISLLKVFLGLPVANTQAMEWVFVDAAVGAVDNPFNLSKNNASAPLIEHDFSADSNVDLVGIIRGDVDGSWTAN